MKKLIVLFILSAGLLTLTGCDLFGGSDQSSDETTDSSVLKAEKADITNSVYTLKVRKDMDLSAGQLTFTDKKWNGHARIRHKELILLNHLKKNSADRYQDHYQR